MFQSRLPYLCLLLVIGAWSQNAPLKEQFTTNLLKELAKEGGNVVFSPTSLDSALSIVGYGARGMTEEQVYSTLGYNPATAKKEIAAKQTLLNVTPSPGAIWKSANRIMAAPDLPVKKDYLSEVSAAFPGVSVTNFDYENPTKTAGDVNAWVSQNTNNVIKKLLEPDDINSQTRMIILNAVYFMGEWKHGFDKSKTKKECFYSTPSECTMTEMMHLKQDFKYGYSYDMKAQIIEFPYKDENYSMIVVLPHEKENSITSLINNLNVDEVLNFIDKRGWNVEVHVTMPKFEIEFSKQMKDPLQKLGIKNLFTDASDLSGMVTGVRASVNSVVHKAKITCDEKGTVAAAATGSILQGRSFVEKERHFFVADRPFAYFLRNKGKGVLFAGVTLKAKL